VKVTSGDEFEELATSFNNMAKQLGRQFNALTTMAEIDRAILSALDTERIVRTVFNSMRQFLPYDSLSVTLLDPKGLNPGRTFMETGSRLKLFENVHIPPAELERFVAGQELIRKTWIRPDNWLIRWQSPWPMPNCWKIWMRSTGAL
jgi:transcriptional regulator with GAF, ATPase, and Fis domain